MTTLWSLIDRRARQSPDDLFAVDGQDRHMTFFEYKAAVLRAAAGLLVAPGEVVSWIMPTSIEAMVMAGALARIGAVQNPILPIYREREIAFISRQTGASRILRDIIDPASPSNGRALDPAPSDPDAVRWLYYTSGTTSEPKGVKHSDATLLASAEGLVSAFELSADDRAALVFPFTHVGGLLWLLASLISGAASIVVDKFDDAAIDVLARHGVTQAGAGTFFHQAYLARQRAQSTPLFDRVRAFPGGGAPKPPELHHEMKRELGGAGIVSGYGLTECPAITMNTVRCPDDKLAHTEGRLSPADAGQIRIVDGEVRVRGPQLFKGYVDATLDEGAFDEQGFFRTGDLGKLDTDGYLTITGRLKDVIIRKGENISAKELEDLLYSHDAIDDVAVIGVPDAVSGERACAVVVGAISLEQMSAFLLERGLSKRKLPEQLELVEALPRNASGKIEKRALRRRYS